MLKAGERKEGNARLQRRKKGKYNTDGGRMKTNELKTVKVSRSISFAVFWLHHSGFLYKLVHYNPATPTSPKSTCFWQLLNNSLGKARKPQIEAELESFPLRKIWEVPTLGGKGKWTEVNLHSPGQREAKATMMRRVCLFGISTIPPFEGAIPHPLALLPPTQPEDSPPSPDLAISGLSAEPLWCWPPCLTSPTPIWLKLKEAAELEKRVSCWFTSLNCRSLHLCNDSADKYSRCWWLDAKAVWAKIFRS